MSLPPLNPEKTAAGIVVDPRTLERVVPSSKRKDGTLRKEQKIRPGFTPQEDVGIFKSRLTAQSSTASIVLGSNNRPLQKKDEKVNPFKDEPKEKTKAQLKNEKRREKKKEIVSVAWDEDEEQDEEVEEMKEAFEKGDRERQSTNGSVKPEVEPDFPPLGKVVETPASKATKTIPTVASSSSSIKTTSTSVQPKASSSTSTPLPHPIQGGRKGPIGLANPPPAPPPVQEPHSSTSTTTNNGNGNVSAAGADSASWRPAQKEQYEKEGKFQRRGGGPASGRGRGGGARGGRLPPGAGARQTPAPAAQAKPPIPVAKEPRERKEVKIRQGGATDIGSLASRVRNLVVANTAGNSPREKRGTTPAPAPTKAE